MVDWRCERRNNGCGYDDDNDDDDDYDCEDDYNGTDGPAPSTANDRCVPFTSGLGWFCAFFSDDEDDDGHNDDEGDIENGIQLQRTTFC
jgi:hypothetical protein